MARRCKVGSGAVWQGTVGLCLAWLGRARQGQVRQGIALWLWWRKSFAFGTVRHGAALQGLARLGKVGPGVAESGAARSGKVR
jgi:hypothetical protein